jgi:hypothetical protein
MANPDAKLNLYFEAVAQTVQRKVQEALGLIGNFPRQLLALRRYIRKENNLDTQWVWTEEQIKAYEASPRAARVRLEVEKVRKKFEELNPGYTLGVSPIRDLQRQVNLWNGNATVRLAADDLRWKCLQEIAGYPDWPDVNARARFRAFLGHCSVQPEPTSAAPGLSDHGQMNAIDFVILQGHRKIAGTTTATIPAEWDAPRWTQKLKEAVTLSHSVFIGPLQHPREPWHYTLPH